jgi:hypothetical protein
MKKLLGTVLAAALLLPPGLGYAEVLKNLSLSGNIDVQSVATRNVRDFRSQDLDKIGPAAGRVLLNADWDMLDDVHATLTAGKVGYAGRGLYNDTQAFREEIKQAKVKVSKVFGHVDMTAGRTYYGEPGDLVIRFGPSDSFGMPTSFIDAFVANASGDMAEFTAMAGHQTANNTNAAARTVAGNLVSPSAKTLLGSELWVKQAPMKVGFYGYRQETHQDLAPNDYLWVYGLKLRGEASGAWFHADAAWNAGENRTAVGQYVYNGQAYLLKAGVNADVPNAGGFGPWVNFGWGSGRSASGAVQTDDAAKNDQFQSISCDYRPGIINRRFDGVQSIVGLYDQRQNVGSCGLSNRVIWGLGLNITPAVADGKFTIGGQFWDYRAQRIDESMNGTLAQATNGVWTRAGGNRHIGSEYGFIASWKHSENVKFSTGWAHFTPGGFIENQQNWNGATGLRTATNGIKPVSMFFGDMGIKF